MFFSNKNKRLVKSTQNSQTVKKVWPMQKRQHEKSCEIKGGSPEVAVVV